MMRYTNLNKDQMELAIDTLRERKEIRAASEAVDPKHARLYYEWTGDE
jgi:hypothetical protein